MADDTTIGIDEWLYSTLSADSVITTAVGTRLYTDEAPAETAFPYVQWQLQSANDVRTGVGPFTILVNALYLVKVVNRIQSYKAIQTVANRINTILHGAGGTTLSTNIYSCVREEAWRDSEFISGVNYRSLGGIYRIQAKGI